MVRSCSIPESLACEWEANTSSYQTLSCRLVSSHNSSHYRLASNQDRWVLSSLNCNIHQRFGWADAAPDKPQHHLPSQTLPHLWWALLHTRSLTHSLTCLALYIECSSSFVFILYIFVQLIFFCSQVFHNTNFLDPIFFCPVLTKLALDLHVNFCLSGLFFKACNWLIYWLLTVDLAIYLSD